MHIAGDRNCWGDLISRSVALLSVSVRATAVYAACALDETLPSKQEIRDAQQASRANLGTLASGAASFMTNVGQVSLDAEGLFRLPVNGRAVLWFLGGAKQLEVRLMIRAHMKKAGHRGVVATLHRLSEYCCWLCMEEPVAEFVTSSASIAWIPKQGRKCHVRSERGCTASGRAKWSTSTISMLERAGRWETMAWMRTGGTDASSS